MKVTDVREGSEERYISEIKVGTVFEIDNEFYIKIPLGLAQQLEVNDEH